MSVETTQPISHTLPALTAEHVDKFKVATLNRYSQLPPALPTIFRDSEFRWLERMSVDMRQVLHTEQVYEYLEPLPFGVPLTITTSLASQRERSGLKLISLMTEIKTGELLCIKAMSSFVVRVKGAGNVG